MFNLLNIILILLVPLRLSFVFIDLSDHLFLLLTIFLLAVGPNNLHFLLLYISMHSRISLIPTIFIVYYLHIWSNLNYIISLNLNCLINTYLLLLHHSLLRSLSLFRQLLGLLDKPYLLYLHLHYPRFLLFIYFIDAVGVSLLWLWG